MIKIDQKKIIEDINKKIIPITDVRKGKRFLDVVCPMLDDMGYSYETDPGSNTFTLEACPGAHILGSENCLHIDIKYSDAAGYSIGYYSLYYHATAMLEYRTMLESLVTHLRALVKHYDECIKKNMLCKLLMSLIEPTLSKEKLMFTRLTPCEYSESFILSKPIFNNLDIETTIDFDNYEEPIRNMAFAITENPTLSWLLQHARINMKAYRSNDAKCQNYAVAKGGARPIYNNVKLYYTNNEPVSSEKKRVPILNRLGYHYSFVSEGLIDITINNRLKFSYFDKGRHFCNFFICIDGKSYFQVKFTTKVFRKFVQMFAVAWNIEVQSYVGDTDNYCINPMELIFSRFLPKGVKYDVKSLTFSPDDKLCIILGKDYEDALNKLEWMSLEGEKLKDISKLWDTSLHITIR